MDGAKPLLRHLLIASLAIGGSAARTQADDASGRFRLVPGTARAAVSPLTPPSARASVTVAAPPIALAPPLSVAPPLSLTTTPSLAEQVTDDPSPGAAFADCPTLPPPALLGKTSATPVEANGTTFAANALDSGPGWRAVGEELKEHLDKCESLLARHAYLSAREEANRGLLRLMRLLDLRQNKFSCEPAWSRAQQALREAEDFTALQRIAEDSDLFARLIQSHQTPALREAQLDELTPLAAAQHYRAYAEKCLVEASQGHPWCAELYYCIGRTLQAQGEAAGHDSDALLQQALTFFRAADTIQPSNATNSNQLGYVLLRMDRPREALAQLNQTVRLPDCPLESWQNLAFASTRLGDRQTAQWATQNYLALKSQGKEPSAPTGTLVEVDPRQFAALSPYTSGPQPAAAPASPAAAPALESPTSQPAAARTAARPASGFFR